MSRMCIRSCPRKEFSHSEAGMFGEKRSSRVRKRITSGSFAKISRSSASWAWRFRFGKTEKRLSRSSANPAPADARRERFSIKLVSQLAGKFGEGRALTGNFESIIDTAFPIGRYESLAQIAK